MDDKRFFRKLKQEVKKTGNRKRRRFLKDVSADPGEFEFGSAESSAFNGRDGKRKKIRHGRPEDDLAKPDEAGTTDPKPSTNDVPATLQELTDGEEASRRVAIQPE